MKKFHMQVTEAFRYLYAKNVPFQRLREIHHTKTLVSNYNNSIKYWAKPNRKFITVRNFMYGMRVINMANEHQAKPV